MPQKLKYSKGKRIQFTYSENPNGALVRHGPSLHCTLGQKMNSLNGIFMPPTEIILFFASQWFLFWFRENWCWWTHKIAHGNTNTQRFQTWNTKESMGKIEQIPLLSKGYLPNVLERWRLCQSFVFWVKDFKLKLLAYFLILFNCAKLQKD